MRTPGSDKCRNRTEITNMPSEKERTDIWERDGRPEGQAEAHWVSAAREQSVHEPADEFMDDEEKIFAGRPDANMPALLTKDVHGG